jgi:SHS2 domain-containing protein
VKKDFESIDHTADISISAYGAAFCQRRTRFVQYHHRLKEQKID